MIWLNGACVEDGKRALQGKRTYNSWQEGLEQIFKAVLENKTVYHECIPFGQQGTD